MTDFPRRPKIVGRGPGGYAPYDIYLDSSLGYVLRCGAFETLQEAQDWLEEQKDGDPEKVVSYWG